jgi:hypothetical protein
MAADAPDQKQVERLLVVLVRGLRVAER